MLRDPRKQRVILVGVLLLGLGFVYYDRRYRPRTLELNAMARRLTRIKVHQETAERLLAQSPLDSLGQALAGEGRRLKGWERFLGSADGLPLLLNRVSQQALASKVRMGLLRPVSPVREEFLVRQTFRLGVHGDYHEIGRFLALVGGLSTLVVPVHLTLTARPAGSPGGGLEARFELRTYLRSHEVVPSWIH